MLVTHTSSRDRRSAASWVVIVAAALYPFLGAMTLFVSALSIIALVAGVTAETPVETEDSSE